MILDLNSGLSALEMDALSLEMVEKMDMADTSNMHRQELFSIQTEICCGLI